MREKGRRESLLAPAGVASGPHGGRLAHGCRELLGTVVTDLRDKVAGEEAGMTSLILGT